MIELDNLLLELEDVRITLEVVAQLGMLFATLVVVRIKLGMYFSYYGMIFSNS